MKSTTGITAVALLFLAVMLTGADQPTRELSPYLALQQQCAVEWAPQRDPDPRNLPIESKSIRKIYDAAGLPMPGSTNLRAPHKDLSWGVARIKKALVEQDIHIDWERWTVYVAHRPGVHWVASLTGLPGARLPAPFDACPVHKRHPWDATPELTRFIGDTRPPLTREEEKRSLSCMEHFIHQLRTNWMFLEPPPYIQAGASTEVSPGMIGWVLHRGLSGNIEPKIKLADLKHLAPFFYESFPAHVLERAEWFDHWNVHAVSVYAYDLDRPQILEIQGSFGFENKEHGFQFDDYFDPKEFRRTHCRTWEDEGATTLRPCNKSDVIVILDGRGNHRLRFLIDARYDPQPELRGKALRTE